MKIEKKSILDKFETPASSQSNMSDARAGTIGNANDWIAVSKKKKTKPNDAMPSKDAEPVPEEASSNKYPKREEILARRAKVKMEKRLKREQLARIEREQKLKNTKLSVVSQDAVTVFQKNKSGNPSSAVSKQTKEFRADEPIDFSIDNEMSAFPSLYSNALSKPVTPKTQAVEEVVQPTITKKKVKVKDQIQFDLDSLIKRNKQKKTQEPPKRTVKKVVKEVPKKGKERENPKQTFTTLRKKLNKEKVERAEGFRLVLSEFSRLQVSEENNGNEEPTSISNKENIEVIQSDDDSSVAEEKAIEPLEEVSIDVEDIMKTDEAVDLKSKSNEDQKHVSKEELVNDIQWLSHPIHTRKFREYCDHLVTPEVVDCATEFINLIVKFQMRLYERDPIKGRSRRRFYCGMRECTRHMKKFVCIFVAPDLDKYNTIGGELMKLLGAAAEFKVPVYYAIRQRALARLCLRKGGVSCMGVTNHQGAQDSYKKLCDAISVARDEYSSIVKSTLPTGPPNLLFEEENR